MKDWLDRVNVRKMRETDLPLIEWDGEYARYRKVYREVYRNQRLGVATALIAESPGDGIVAQIFLTKKQPNDVFSPTERYLFISSFRVKEAFRKRGLGTLLLKMAELFAKKEGLPLLILNCAQSNPEALEFYKRAGFEGYRIDDGNWRYIDHEGNVREENEPAFSMRKRV